MQHFLLLKYEFYEDVLNFGSLLNKGLGFDCHTVLFYIGKAWLDVSVTLLD